MKITAQWNTTRVYLRKSFRRLLVGIQHYRYSNIHLRNLNISFHSLPDLAPHTRQYLRKEDQARNAHLVEIAICSLDCLGLGLGNPKRSCRLYCLDRKHEIKPVLKSVQHN